MINKVLEEKIKNIISKNDQNYNLLKILEELSEFQEVIVKSLTKNKLNNTIEFKDKIDEFGDVVLRGFLFLVSEYITKFPLEKEAAKDIMELLKLRIISKITSINERSLKHKNN